MSMSAYEKMVISNAPSPHQKKKKTKQNIDKLSNVMTKKEEVCVDEKG